MFELILPPIENQSQEFKAAQSIIFIGANGSGKTRLGTWLDISSPQNKKTHRISAQKSLDMPISVSPEAIDTAQNMLSYGYRSARTEDGPSFKSAHRFHGKPATTLLNDFQHLLVLLFSEAMEVNAKYRADSNKSNKKVKVTDTNLEKIKKVWEKILPHRELQICGLDIKTKIVTKITDNNKEEIYHSSEMSDGERVIFYLIGQCLSVAKDSIIIIDEPELHLHKSIHGPLWKEIENLRSDCLFVYLTHDINFASSKTEATKIWIKDFDGKNWQFAEIKKDQGLPEALLLEILGSRKNIIFVEGSEDSYDTQLYRAILKDFLIKPVGSCTQVIQNVKAFKSNNQLHHLKCYGIIDRDRRIDHEILDLESYDIYTLNLAEVENFFCTEEVIKFAAIKMEKNVDEVFENAKTSIFKNLSNELENQVSLHVMSEVKHLINHIPDSWKGKEQIKQEITNHFNQIQINDIYNNIQNKFSKIISEKNFDDLLRYYNRKSLHHKIATEVGINSKELPSFVIRYVSKDSGETLINSLKKYFGNFPFND